MINYIILDFRFDFSKRYNKYPLINKEKINHKLPYLTAESFSDNCYFLKENDILDINTNIIFNR